MGMMGFFLFGAGLMLGGCLGCAAMGILQQRAIEDEILNSN